MWAQYLAIDPPGTAATLNDDPHGVGRVLGTAAATAALALASGAEVLIQVVGGVVGEGRALGVLQWRGDLG